MLFLVMSLFRPCEIDKSTHFQSLLPSFKWAVYIDIAHHDDYTGQFRGRYYTSSGDESYNASLVGSRVENYSGHVSFMSMITFLLPFLENIDIIITCNTC